MLRTQLVSFCDPLKYIDILNCSVIQRKLRAKHEAKLATADPARRMRGVLSRFAMSADVRAVFARAFSRPPRLLFGNPVCALFSIYFGESEGRE
jgi:hypothetical protein